MIFTKEELKFLSIYAKCADTKQTQNDKFQIKTDKETQSVVFSQFSDATVVITELKKKVDENFVGIYPIEQFLSLVQSLPNEAVLDIKNNGIHFNNNKYEFEKYDMESSFADTQIFVELLATDGKTIVVNDFAKTKNSIIGRDDLECVTLVKGNFLSSISGDTLTCSYRSSNDVGVTFYIPKLAVNLCNEAKLDLVSFDVRVMGGKEFSSVMIGNTRVIFPPKEYNTDIVQLFEEDSKHLYDHPSKIVFNKEVLKSALNRIKVFSSNNIYSRVYCSTTNNQFKIESKEQNSGYAVEIVESDMDDVLKNQDSLFCTSQTYFGLVLSYLKGDTVHIQAKPFDADTVAIKITDEIGEDFFILCLLLE